MPRSRSRQEFTNAWDDLRTVKLDIRHEGSMREASHGVFQVEAGRTFIPWFPMATGRLAKPGGPLRRIAGEHAVAPAQLALAWLLPRSPVLLPIPGTSTVAHLEENVGAALIKLSPDQIQQLDNAI